MTSFRPPLFWKRKFQPQAIVTCVRWYLRFCLSLRDLEELMAERGLAVDHTSIWRWVQTYGPELNGRLQARLNGSRPLGTWMRLSFASPENGCTCSAP
jgi:IS6 family transposase